MTELILIDIAFLIVIAILCTYTAANDWKMIERTFWKMDDSIWELKMQFNDRLHDIKRGQRRYNRATFTPKKGLKRK